MFPWLSDDWAGLWAVQRQQVTFSPEDKPHSYTLCSSASLRGVVYPTHTPGIWKEFWKEVRDEEEEEEGARKCLSVLWFKHPHSATCEATAELSNQDCIVLQNKTLNEKSWDGCYTHTWTLHESWLVTVRAECSCCRPVQWVGSE